MAIDEKIGMNFILDRACFPLVLGLYSTLDRARAHRGCC